MSAHTPNQNNPNPNNPKQILFRELQTGYAKEQDKLNKTKQNYIPINTTQDILNKPKSLFVIPDNTMDASLPRNRKHQRQLGGGIAAYLNPGKTKEGKYDVYEVNTVSVPTLGITTGPDGKPKRTHKWVTAQEIKEAFEEIYAQLGTGAFTEIVVPYEPKGYDRNGDPDGTWKAAFGTEIAGQDIDPKIIDLIAKEFEKLRDFLTNYNNNPSAVPNDLEYLQAFRDGKQNPGRYLLRPNGGEPTKFVGGVRQGLNLPPTNQQNQATATFTSTPAPKPSQTQTSVTTAPSQIQAQSTDKPLSQIQAISTIKKELKSQSANPISNAQTQKNLNTHPVTFERKRNLDSTNVADSKESVSKTFTGAKNTVTSNTGTKVKTKEERTSSPDALAKAQTKAQQFFNKRKTELEQNQHYDFTPGNNFAYTVSLKQDSTLKKDSTPNETESTHVDYMKGTITSTVNPSDMLLMMQMKEAVMMAIDKKVETITISNCTPEEGQKMMRFASYFTDKFKADNISVVADKKMCESPVGNKTWMEEFENIGRVENDQVSSLDRIGNDQVSSQRITQSIDTTIAEFEKQSPPKSARPTS